MDSFNPTAGLGRAKELPQLDAKPSMPPRKYRINERCNRSCSLNLAKHPPRIASLIHSWYEDGWNNFNIRAKAAMLDTTISDGAIARHRRNHLEVVDVDEADIPEEVSKTDGEKLSDVQILDRIVAQGARNLSSKAVKVSPEMLMRAMELKYKLTQGSVMEDTFAAIGKAMSGENPMAVQGAEETEQQFSDSAPEVSDERSG